MNYLNGQFKEHDFSEGELYGTGVFETIKISDKTPEYLKEHYTRLCSGCKAISIGFSIEYITFEKEINFYIYSSNLDNFSLRVTVLKRGSGYDFMINTRTLPYTRELFLKGYSLKIGSLLRNPTSPLTFLKSVCYTDNLLSLGDAREKGYDEVLHMNFKKKICEGALSNIFFIKDGVLKTPAVECGLLPGIMRAQVLKKSVEDSIPVEEGNYTLEEILNADEVFVTNSLMGIMPVSNIEDKRYKEREITERISKIL